MRGPLGGREQGVSAVMGTGRHRLGGGEEKGGGGRDSNGFRVGLGLGQREVDWINRVKWSRVDLSGRVNAPIFTTGRN